MQFCCAYSYCKMAHANYYRALISVLLVCFSLSTTTNKKAQSPNVNKNEKPKFKATFNAGTKSNAHNFLDAAARVDKRTGTLSFAITVGHFVTHSKRFDIKLQYNSRFAEANLRPFDLGTGWTLSLPWINLNPAEGFNVWTVYMGDGSSYTLEKDNLGKDMLRYYPTKDVKVGSDGNDFYVTKGGDTWWVTPKTKLVKNFTSKEGFTLTFPQSHRDVLANQFYIKNGTDKVFWITQKPCDLDTCMKLLLHSWTNFGEIVYQATIYGGLLLFLKCEYCPWEHHHVTVPLEEYIDYRFDYDHRKRMIGITYPTKAMETFKYGKVGFGTSEVGGVVVKVKRNPGSPRDLAVNLYNKDARIGDLEEHYNYNRQSNGHDYLGSPHFAVPRIDGRDALLETEGEYSYHVEHRVGKKRTLYEYDKMHLETKQTVYEYNKKENTFKVYKVIEKQYPCTSILDFLLMEEDCGTNAAFYMFPNKTTTTEYGDASAYKETVTKQYDVFGKVIFESKADGQSVRTEWGPQRAVDAGQHRYPLKQTFYPSGYKETDPSSFYYEARFQYKQFPKLNSPGMFALLDKRMDYHVKGDDLTLIREKIYDYFDNDQEPLTYGRLKEERESAPGAITVKTSHSYEFRDGMVNGTTIKSSTGQGSDKAIEIKSKISERSTNFATKMIQPNGVINFKTYDILGRITEAGDISRDLKRNISTKIKYNVNYNNNSKVTTHPDGRVEIEKYDNLNHLLEKVLVTSPIEGKPKSFTTTILFYNEIWTKRMVTSQQHLGYKPGTPTGVKSHFL